MPRRYWWYIAAFILIVALAAIGMYVQAHAQAPGGYDCDVNILAGGAFDAHCEPQVTETPTEEPVWTETATISAATATPQAATPTSTSTSTATSQPPTAQPPTTATSTPTASSSTPTPTPQADVLLRVNVPLTDAPAGDAALDANNRAILWAGAISPDGGYAQVRLIGTRDGLSVYVQSMQPTFTGAAVRLGIGVNSYTIRFPATAPWAIAYRGGRGWSASRVIPWAELGGRPNEGDVWPLAFSAPDGDTWRGALHWGLPDYGGRAVQGAQVLTLPLSADASLGGGTDCAADDDPNNGRVSSFFAEWGSNNVGISGSKLISLGSIAYANVQAQWDTADWPCYARYLTKWRLPSLPDGAQVVSATLSLYKFGHSGYAGEPTGTNVMQVWEASPDWTEAGVSWDNGPAVWENVSRLPVGECSVANCATGEWHAFDVTEIVRRALARGDSEAAALLYTAAGQYHSGRYFYTREGSIKPVVRIAYTLGGEEPTWTITPTTLPGPGRTPTASITPMPSVTLLPTPSPSSTSMASVSPTPNLPPPTVTISPASPTPLLTPTSVPDATCTRYVSPGGLAAAVAALKAGDVLCLRDGTYNEAIAPRTNGTQAQPITIKALNDGKATIDGQGVRKPLNLGEGTGGGNWFVIEGLVLRNGPEHVVIVKGSNNVLRRVSVYDANPDANSQIVLIWNSNNVIEDCIVGGTGRIGIDVFGGGGMTVNNNTVRRCYVQWERWDGRAFCGIQFPGSFGITAYNSSGGTYENNVISGKAVVGILIQANHDAAAANDNAVLGNIAVGMGKERTAAGWQVWRYGSPTWPTLTRPGPTTCTTVTDWTWPGQRVGIQHFGQGTMVGNVYRDNIAVDSAGLGFSANNPGGGRWSGTVIERMTLFGNGSDAPSGDGGKGAQAKWPPGVACQNCRIGTAGTGGAILQRYENRQPTGEPLTDWPMEGRALAELGVSVEAIIQEYSAR